MNLALLSQLDIFVPLHGVLRWLSPPRVEPRHQQMQTGGFCADSAPKFIATHTASISPQGAYAAIERPLRVVRMLEDGQARNCVGRMVISGRMADVCAELDRLAARESTLS